MNKDDKVTGRRFEALGKKFYRTKVRCSNCMSECLLYAEIGTPLSESRARCPVCDVPGCAVPLEDQDFGGNNETTK